MEPDLTIVLVADAEKPAEVWDRRWFAAIEGLNRDATDSVQVLVLSQRTDDGALVELAHQSPFRVDVVNCGHPRAANGYPIWDLVAMMRQVWPMVRGEWVTFSHLEYIYGPGRLGETIGYLRGRRDLPVALGNLRRCQFERDLHPDRQVPHDALSDLLCDVIDEGRWEFLREMWWLFGVHPWTYREPEPGPCEWDEDIFVARRDWLDAMDFWKHGGRLPFQDIYDLMHPALTRLRTVAGIDLQCWRLGREILDAAHILHGRDWGSHTPEVRDWFLRHADQFPGYALIDPALWATAIDGDTGLRVRSIYEIRRGEGGTTTRWRRGFVRWLRSGGAQRMRAYFNTLVQGSTTHEHGSTDRGDAID